MHMYIHSKKQEKVKAQLQVCNYIYIHVPSVNEGMLTMSVELRAPEAPAAKKEKHL